MNACRHFGRCGMRLTCAAGRDIEAWVRRCGSPQGWGRMLPCRKHAPEKPLFECPEVDRKTDAEVEAERQAMRDHMDRFVKGLPAIQGIKRKMIANGLAKATATCPWCGDKDTLTVTVADCNNHARAQCSSCEMGFME